MKIYLAAPYAARDRIKRYSDELTRIGYTVTSSWLDESHPIGDGTTGAATGLDDGQVALQASTDLADIDKADLLVLFTSDTARVGIFSAISGGRHIETGYAIAKGLPVLVVGEPENIFHRLGRAVTVVSDWHEAVLELAARLVNERRHEAVAVDA